MSIRSKLRKILWKEKKNVPIQYDVGTKNAITRDEWIITRLKDLPNDSRLLDAGAGEQPYKVYCDHLNYVSQDFAAYSGTGDKKGLQTKEFDYKKLDIISDIISIPEPDNSFDAILCSEVIEHVPEPVTALRELQRLVKKGGKIILTAPFCSLTHFSPFHYSTGFNRYFYEHHFENLGFRILETNINGNYFEYLGQELRRIQSVASQYTDYSLKPDYYNAANVILRELQELSDHDKGSAELLSFGYHIYAEKK